MKKSFVIFMLSSLLLTSLCLFSCGSKTGLQHVDGQVASTRFYHDSLLAVARVTVGNDTMSFDMAEAQYIGGMVMAGDSVSIDYVETKGDTLRAYVVTLKPRTQQQQPNPDGELLTRPAEQDTLEVKH